MAEKNLKDSNKANLAGILVGTIVVMALIQVGLKEVNDAYSAIKDLGLVAGLTIVANILASLLPADFKHKLVFLRFSDVLPGHRSKELCLADPRLDDEALTKQWPELFSEDMPPSKQNSFWYGKIYSPVKDTNEVKQAHKSFLLYRDALSGIFLLLLSVVAWQLTAPDLPIEGPSPWIYLFLLFTSFLVMFSAQNAGKRMVVNAAAKAINS
ncbi:hypothetical protein IC617_06030 [Neiella sp. HB171785]|uniref:Uncharacterized protein n=1 Tax=Neiella litorisoli TaxID=2771431 RepID=A0A8J6UPN9_9GAMM|nr:hypothetical protein [Neiella litorisoli]MBD1388982.1 hypothetical protein [Neiella litorisoli]